MASFTNAILDNFSFSIFKSKKRVFKDKSVYSLEEIPFDNDNLSSVTAFLTDSASEKDKEEYANMLTSMAKHLDWKGQLQIKAFTKTDNKGNQVSGTSLFINKSAPIVRQTLEESMAFVASLSGSASK